MSATKLLIKSRHREHPGVIASLADFDWRPSASMDAQLLMGDPRYSLYCLDAEHEVAVFAALPPGLDLSRTPFMYQAQFDRAEHLVTMPLLDFVGIADSDIFPAESLLFLHNIGRCGSTALTRALNEVEGFVAYSEPDALASLLSLGHWSRAMRNALIHASLVWLCRPAPIGGETRFVVKLRNQATAIMKNFVDAMPEAQHIFMYRNAIDWLASFHRLRSQRGDIPTRYHRDDAISQQADYYRCPRAEIEALAPPEIPTYLGLEGRALGWLFMLGRYLDLHGTGWPVRALRYEDLQADREGVLRRIVELLGLPEADLTSARASFTADAQAGTRFARDNARGNQLPLPPEMRETVRRVLASQSVPNRADFTLPGQLLQD